MLPESFMISCPVVLLSRRPGAGSRDCLDAPMLGAVTVITPAPGSGSRAAGPSMGECDAHRSQQREQGADQRSEEHTSELQSRGHLVCRLLLEKKTHATS